MRTKIAATQPKLIRSLSRRKSQLLHKLYDNLYAMSTRIKRERMHYLIEAQFFAWVCGQTWAQRHYWTTKVEIVQRFLCETNLPRADSMLTLPQVMQQALFCDVFFPYWNRRIRTWQPHQLAQIITVHGWEAWLAAYQQGKGVLLAPYHTLATRLLSTWLVQAGIEPLLKIGRRDEMRKGIQQTNWPFFYARQLQAAQACLGAGGVVLILPDGFQGNKGSPLPLYQRNRLFSSAFAELALLTGAPVTPASVILNLAGKIEITFHPPLSVGEKSQPRSEQIEALMQQYVAFLHTEWCAAPGNISIRHMEEFLKNSNPIVQHGTGT